MSDSSLGLLFSIDADASKADAKTADFMAQYERRLDAVNAIMAKNAQISGETANAIVDGWERQDAAAARAGAATKAAVEESAGAVNGLGASLDNLGSRLVNRLILSELVYSLRDLPSIIENVTGALAGWGQEQQKEFAEQLKINAEAVKTYDAIREAEIHLTATTQTESVKRILAIKEAELLQEQTAAVAMQNQLNRADSVTKAYAKLGKAGELLDLTGRTAEYNEMSVAMDKASTKAAELADEVRRLSGIALPKAQKEDAEKSLQRQLDLMTKQIQAQFELNEQRIKGSAGTDDLRYGEQVEALTKYYALENDLIEKSLAKEKSIHGTQSEEYKALLDKKAELDKQYTSKEESYFQELIAAQQRYAAEVRRFIDDSSKAQEEASRRKLEQADARGAAQAEIARKMAEDQAKINVDIEKDIRERVALEQRSNNEQLAIVDERIKNELGMRRISRSKAYVEEKAALETWHNQGQSDMQRDLDMAKRIYGEKSEMYRALILQMEQMDTEYYRRKGQLDRTDATSFAQKVQQTEGMLQQLSGAFASHHNAKMAFIIAEAAIKATEEIAKGLEYLSDAAVGVPGAGVAAGFAFASAAEYAAVGGFNAASSSGGGGSGGSGSGGSSSGRGVNPSVYGGNSPVKAGGSIPPLSNVTIHVYDAGQMADNIAGVLNTAVQSQGVKLAASHNPSGQAL